MTTEKQERSSSGVSGLVFVGCFLVALALGLLFGNMPVFILGGIGVGFILMAIARFAAGEW